MTPGKDGPMDTALVIAIVVVVLLLALLAFFAGRQRRSRRLQDTFGPEYERTVSQAGDRRAAPHPGPGWPGRRGGARVGEGPGAGGRLGIVRLAPEPGTRCIEACRDPQAQFVDEPVEATR